MHIRYQLVIAAYVLFHEPATLSNRGDNQVVAHLLGVSAAALVLTACIFLPFLPGRYDALAVPLSMLAQVLSRGGLLLVPIGAIWLVHEVRNCSAQYRQSSRNSNVAYYLAIVSLIVASIVWAFAALGMSLQFGFSLGVGAILFWIYGVTRIWPQLRRLKAAEPGIFNPAPLYLIAVPVVAVIAQVAFLRRATEFSRNRAIENSEELIHDIEQYRIANGRYPLSLSAVNPDYEPLILGIRQYHYEPNGKSYNLYFEQFTYRIGTREIVMYNPQDEHFMASHDMDILRWTPEQLAARRGYYEVHDARASQWKYFWFD